MEGLGGPLAAIVYPVAAAAVAAGLLRNSPGLANAGRLLGLAAAIGHGAFLLAHYTIVGGIDASLFSMLSWTGLVIVLVVLATSLRFPVTELCIPAFPLAAVLVILQQTLVTTPRALALDSVLLETHVLASLLAFSLLTIAAFNAMFIAALDRSLRSHRAPAMLNVLPPLAVMERALFQLLWAGWLVLSLSLASGLFFLQDIFGQHLAHKTILSVCAWLVFGGLLFGRWRFGWRGMPAVRLTLIGMAILVLAYFGSKAVLELLLDRAWHSGA